MELLSRLIHRFSGPFFKQRLVSDVIMIAYRTIIWIKYVISILGKSTPQKVDFLLNPSIFVKVTLSGSS